MRAVVQRVHEARVSVDHKTVGDISKGLLVYLGIAANDHPKDIDYMVKKIAGLRIFPDAAGHMNRSVVDAAGQALVISQFTLFGDVRRGMRPSFTDAMPPETAEQHYNTFCDRLACAGVPVEKGIFGAMMDVQSINDGPVTILIDSTKHF
jgi:D-aminoacyl-tRNA deacylase